MRIAIVMTAAVLTLLAGTASGALGGSTDVASRLDTATHPAKRLDKANLHESIGAFRDRVLRGHVRRFYDSPALPYRTADGMTVFVSFSDLYTADPAIAQSYADFLGWLAHGTELNGLYVYVYTPAQIDLTCGQGAAACYFPSLGAMFVAGEDNGGIPVEQAVAHEYGHHIAEHRLNTPWAAGDWGPKRWATYENVCANVAAGRMFPGAEPPDPNYTLNPGEGWAEGYRYMNELRAGNWPPIGWIIVNQYFLPDQTALNLIGLDVANPWTGPKVYVKRGRFKGRGQRQFKFYPYDGPMSASVTGTARATITFVVGGKVVKAPAHRISGTVCGAPSVTVRVQTKRAGRFTLQVSEDNG
jgi:hypothetical protein